MRTLFKQNPKVEKYKPAANTRSVAAIDLDRKGELEKFRKWLEFAAKEKADFPDKSELDKLNKETKSSRASTLGLLGLLAALPLATKFLGDLGGFNLGSIGSMFGGSPTSAVTAATKPVTSGGMSGLARFGVRTGVKLGVGAAAGIAKSLTAAPKPPAIKPTSPPPGRRPVTTSGGARPGRPDIRNPLRQRPGVTTSGGARPGRPDIRNPLRQRPRVTQGSGGQKALDRLVKRLFNSKVGLKAIGKFLKPAIRSIPFLGTVIGSLVDVFVFGDNAGRAIFKNIIGGIMAGAAVGLVTFLTGGIGFLGSALVGGAAQQGGVWLGEWMYDKVFGGNQASTKTTAPSDMSADEILGGTPPTNDPNYQRVSYETADSRAQVTSGQVVQWLHGNPDREGYRADHGGDNAHDHFSFKTRAAAVEGFRALKKAGYKPNEFEGFTSVGRHSPTGGHFGPVGQPPTYDDTSDGVAFDIPWATYGSGPITQKDYDLSFRAAQIVGAVQGGASVDSQGMLVQQPGQEPDYGSGRTVLASGVRQDMDVAMYSPEAEAMNSGITIIREQAPIQQQQQGGGIIPIPVHMGGNGSAPAIIAGMSLDSMMDNLLLTKLDNA